jgi:thiamine biosynthesis lipoprotein
VLCSCGKKEKLYTSYSFDYFDTVTEVSGYCSSQEQFDEIYSYVEKMLGEYHRLFTIYHRYAQKENLCTVNELVDGQHRTVTVDERIIDMLLFAKDAYTRTNGKLNVAMGSVLKLWHNARQFGAENPAQAKLPSASALQEASLHTDIECLIIDRDANTVFLSDPALTLDVGAVAKGYAVEMIARELEGRGISGFVLNVGGNVRTIGKKPSGECWRVGVENPDKDAQDAYIARLFLCGEALVTSGTYQRYYIVDGVRYHHIIDPSTLFPSEWYSSVSVVCESSADADVLSTALFCMPLEEGMALIENTDGAEACWVLTDGTLVRSSGFAYYEKERP